MLTGRLTLTKKPTGTLRSAGEDGPNSCFRPLVHRLYSSSPGQSIFATVAAEADVGVPSPAWSKTRSAPSAPSFMLDRDLTDRCIPDPRLYSLSHPTRWRSTRTGSNIINTTPRSTRTRTTRAGRPALMPATISYMAQMVTKHRMSNTARACRLE